jgi:hypothetical protein
MQKQSACQEIWFEALQGLPIECVGLSEGVSMDAAQNFSAIGFELNQI